MEEKPIIRECKNHPGKQAEYNLRGDNPICYSCVHGHERIRCPNCQAVDVMKIEKPGLGFYIMTGGLGVALNAASGNMGKQYYCKKCSYKW